VEVKPTLIEALSRSSGDALLASPRTANVTGSSYVVDGGLVKTT